MRNRSIFLNSSSSPFAPSLPSEETLTFLNLPSPHLPPDPYPLLADHCLLCFDSISPFDLCCEIEKFPIDSVLSNVLRDILPDFIEVDDEGFKTAPIGTRPGLGDGAPEGEEAAREEEEKDGKYHHENSVQGAEVPPFETPELQIYLDNPQSVDKEALDIFFQVSEIESTEDATDLGLQLQCTFEAQETMSLVGDSGLEHLIQSEANLLEDDDPGEGDPSFPLLEVNEMSLTTLSSICAEEEVEKFLVVVEAQPLTSKEDLEIVSSNSLILKEECFLEYPFIQKQFLEYDLRSSDKLLERDFLSILEHSTSFLAPANRDCVIPGTLPIFENVQVLDVDSLLLGDILQYQKLIEHESCNEMQQEEVRLNGFQELIISQELSPVDNIFKSLHVPTLPDCLIMRPLYAIVEEVLVNLKPCPPSASDGIYLDWHLLEKDECKDFVLSSGQIMLEVIELLSLESDWDTSAAEKVVYNFIFGECTTNDSCDECCTEPLNMLSDGCSVHNRCLSGSSCMPSNDTCRMPETERLATECNSNGASFLLESMSTFDDLNFFLNPSKATAGNSLLNAAEVHRGRTLKVPTCGSLSEVSWSEHHSGPWTIKIYLVKLSDEIVSVSECLKESYLGLLEGDARFKAAHKSLSEATDSYSLLKVPKQVFMDCMKKANSVTPDLIQCAEYVGVFATLCAIKQLAWYMCFYGLLPARLYIDKLCQLDGFKSRLSRLRHIVSSVDGASQGPITTSHPSLSVIQVLLSNSNPKGVKALILAERIFWQCVKSLLTSMGLSFHELNIWQVNGSPSVNMENLLDKDCLLASFEQISSCFPFDKFGIILEHGGACHSSRISSLHPSLFTLPQLHFLKVELGEWSSSLALCEGVSPPLNSSNIVEGTSLGRTDECMDVWKLERIIDFVPYKDEGLTSSNKPFSEEPSPNPLESPLTESDYYQPKKAFVCNKAIVVNTQNSNEAMILSRRSTYQKILALEKVGIQVIERDSNLPVDIMLNTSTCLVWYTCQNIGKKASGPTEGYSWLQSYVENIAINVLTLLSFSFGACVLIFEGDIGFISTVMESSDGLYAAAVGLGIHIQLFCSYSPELTDEIILNCITSEAKPRDGLYLALTESESLAESFLTKFPSINPLTANAILSSGTTLMDFLEWSNECRASTLEKYGVPQESISLFTALCRYGELEDSQSIMTDCSSSVSSGPDSKSCQNKFDSGRKQCYPENPGKFAMCIDDSLQFQNSKCPIDRTGEHSEIGRLPEKFEDIQIHTDPKIRDHSFNGRHREIGQISARSSAVPSNQKAFQSHDGVFNENLGLFNELNYSDWSDQEWADVMLQKTGGKEIFHSDPVVSACGQSTSFLPEMGKVGRKYSLDAHESSFGKIDCPTFPMERASDFASSLPNYVEEWQVLPGLTSDALFSEQKRDDLSINKNHRSMDGNMGRFFQRPYTDSHEIPAREDTPNDRGTPLRSALSSPHLGKGSPWTVEFLNRIREKSKVRRQLLPPEASPRPDVARHVSNPPKRRSPSILEFFKYRGSGTIPRTAEQKRQKKTNQSAGSSGNRKMSVSFVPTWTPIDKKSSQVLSFSTNGSGSQTKLVWSDGCRYPSVGRNLRSSML